jgi:hypothetical protein
MLDAVLLTLQLLLSASSLKTFVSAARTPDAIESDLPGEATSQELDNLLAPRSYVLCVWSPLLLCFSFAVALGPKSAVGSFIDRYSTPLSREHVCLALALTLVGIAATSWTSFVQGGRRHLAFAALVLMWSGVLPFYLVLGRRCPVPRTAFDVVSVTLGELSVRLYFTWISGAVLFALLDEVQGLYGDYFSFATYAQLMGGMLAMTLGAYLQGRDPVVALMATWFVVGLANRRDSFDGDTRETFERLQNAATVIKSVFLMVLIIDAVRGLRLFLQEVSATAVHVEIDGTWLTFCRACRLCVAAAGLPPRATSKSFSRCMGRCEAPISSSCLSLQ